MGSHGRMQSNGLLAWNKALTNNPGAYTQDPVIDGAERHDSITPQGNTRIVSTTSEQNFRSAPVIVIQIRLTA